MQGVSILTDIQIPQSPEWVSHTVYLGARGGLHWTGALPKWAQDILLPACHMLLLIREGRNYDVIVTANLRTAQLIGLYRSLINVRRPKHLVLEVMLDEARPHLWWKIKRWIQQCSFASVDCIVVSSSSEVLCYSERLRLAGSKFRTLLFHTNIIEPRRVKGDGGYILAAGKTGRDYAALAEAVRGLNVEVIIVSDEASLEGVALPPNARVLLDVPYGNYLKLLHGCQIVVVPLRRLVKSTGQVVILEAMGLGKPVIATATTGTLDYIESGRTGILVPAGDAASLREAIMKLLSDPELQESIGREALEAVKAKHTFDAYTAQIFHIAHQLREVSGDLDKLRLKDQAPHPISESPP